MQKALYKINKRQVGTAVALSIISQRGDLISQSAEKIIPPVVEYDETGSYKLISIEEIISGYHQHPYKPNSPDFNVERLADLQVSNLLKRLENFPSLTEYFNGESFVVHPISEYIYRNIVYLKPTAKLGAKLGRMDYYTKSNHLPVILEKLAENIEKETGLKLDFYSVPKRRVGKFAYIGDPKTGISIPAKHFAFGFHKAIPCDRIARELSSLKQAEEFVQPVELPFKFNSTLSKFVSYIRVAIVGVKSPMLDAADLYKSAIPKLAAKIVRKREIKNFESVPVTDRNIKPKNFRAGIELVHITNDVVDELVTMPGTVRLIFPGGVKVAGQFLEQQAYDADGLEIDCLMDFETFAKKGALATLVMSTGEHYGKELDREDCLQIFKSMRTQPVYLNGTEYQGYVGYLPVMRPGQRYTELSKPSNGITRDLVYKSILNERLKSSTGMENDYQELREFRQAINQEIRRNI